uniref:NPH3 domain-containing protein n=1 Tax=Heterorhabditis bacteriophora TaxID=37862 RepID=A0A1I7WW84_HETBA
MSITDIYNELVYLNAPCATLLPSMVCIELLALKAEADASLTEVDKRVDMILNKTNGEHLVRKAVKEEADEESNDTDITSCNTSPHQHGSVGQSMKWPVNGLAA